MNQRIREDLCMSKIEELFCIHIKKIIIGFIIISVLLSFNEDTASPFIIRSYTFLIIVLSIHKIIARRYVRNYSNEFMNNPDVDRLLEKCKQLNEYAHTKYNINELYGEIYKFGFKDEIIKKFDLFPKNGKKEYATALFLKGLIENNIDLCEKSLDIMIANKINKKEIEKARNILSFVEGEKDNYLEEILKKLDKEKYKFKKVLYYIYLSVYYFNKNDLANYKECLKKIIEYGNNTYFAKDAREKLNKL